MKATTARERFRAILAGDACVFPASVYDPVSARLAEDLGYETAMFAGSVASLAVLGAPDLIVLTLSEFAGLARRICRASSIPLLVDADHGYGNALNVRRSVEELECAGVAALTIEDTELPHRFGDAGLRLVGMDEGVGKIHAAVDARDDPALVIVARTSVGMAKDLDEVVGRCNAYARAGADALFIAGLRTREELEAIRAAVQAPLILATLTKVLHDRPYLSRNGVKVALQGHLPVMAAIRATEEALRALREGALPETLDGIASKALVNTVTRTSDYDRWVGTFMTVTGKAASDA